MRIIFWRDKPVEWQRPPCPECGHGEVRGYKAGDLVTYAGNEWVCINTHGRSFQAPNISTLWARVLR